MKLNFKQLWLLAPLAAVFFNVGCQTSVPPIGVYSAPATTPNYSLVNNFEGNLGSQAATYTNANLYELNTTNNVIVSPGEWVAPTNNFPGYASVTMAIEGPGAAGTALACHITGTLTDPGDGITYPQIVLNGVLDTGHIQPYNAYDGTFWTGVKFYVNITSNDTTTYRYFDIPTSQEAPSGSFQGVGGTCVVTTGNKCYNYFGYSLLNLTPGWHQVSVNFSQLTNISTNTQTVPPTFTGVNLQQILALQWAEGRNNAKGTSTADFWVDEVYFFQ